MTDSDVIKALECCSTNGECRHCPANPHKGNYGYCTSGLMQEASLLIIRQKAEIEMWKAEHKRACAERDARIATSEFIKSEARREFAERLKPLLFNYYDSDIDNLLKEMESENDV